jgi:hypothetical protein
MNPKDDSAVRTLRAEIRESLAVLERIETFLMDYQDEKLLENPGLEEAMVVTQSLTNYYTCLETLFLRISRFFENSLDREQWHRSLLEKMALEIEDFRPRVIGRDVYLVLLELLKFRHFARYYFELDYDWDKLRFLLKKFNWVRSEVRLNLVEFDRFLRQLLSK